MSETTKRIEPEQLHKWYLEAITYLHPDSFNVHADRPYEDLTEEQRSIDKYIANKIATHLHQEVLRAYVEGWDDSMRYYSDVDKFKKYGEKFDKLNADLQRQIKE